MKFAAYFLAAALGYFFGAVWARVRDVLGLK